MRHVVIYHSQTGFTAQYALWISQAAGADCLELSAAKRACLKEYDAIIFGSWVRAGTLCQSRWLKRNLETAWAGRKVLVFCVGGSPIDNPETQEFLEKLRAELKGAEVFYCPGGFRHERMSLPSKLMIRVFVRSLRAKKERTPEEEEAASRISSSYDLSDRKYITPILERLELCVNHPS